MYIMYSFPRPTSLPSDNFLSGNIPNVHFPNRQLPKGQFRPSEALQAAMGGGQDRLWKLSLGKLHIWEIDTWENTLGKLPLGKNPLGKYLTSFHRALYSITSNTIFALCELCSDQKQGGFISLYSWKHLLSIYKAGCILSFP